MSIVSLFSELAKSIFAAEEIFFQNPRDLHSLETSVKTSTEAFAARFLGEVLSGLDKCIYESTWRDGKYAVQRRDKRTLISSVGDVTFDCTYYRGIGDRSGFKHLLEDLIGLERNERFTEAAEVAMLCEALKTSYREAARVLPSKQVITKTTVMNKVHGIAEEIPDATSEERRSVPYLYVEADEDHVAEQHGRSAEEGKNGSFMSKLVYVYECRRETDVRDRFELVNKYYFGGLYAGREGTRRLWEKVNRFIESNYDTEDLKRIFVSGDGAGWIKAGASCLGNAVFCADKYHLMQYLNAAAGQFPEEKDAVKENLWHLLHSDHAGAKKRFDAYTGMMMETAKNPKVVEQLRAYVLGNWSAVRRTLKNELLTGCSAESHVSHVLSDRLSSRPMGWSQSGADRMSKLRCYERNNGREKIIDLVRYSRERRRMGATGTEDLCPRELSVHDVTDYHRSQARAYIERIQAHIPFAAIRRMSFLRDHMDLL